MEISGKREFDLLKKIGFVRMAGTEQEKQAAEILMEEVRSIGLEPVCEEFEIEDADITAAQLEILRPYSKTYTVTAYKLSENTPERTVPETDVATGHIKPVNRAHTTAVTAT